MAQEKVKQSDCIICKKGYLSGHEHRKEFLKPVSTCYGVTNKTKDGQFVLFADYDNVLLDVLIRELDDLIKAFPNTFTNFVILESSESQLTKHGVLGSYHVVNFAKMPYQLMREKLARLSVDDDFYKLPAKTSYRTNTLRISPKFAWGSEKVLKDAPRFICYYPVEKKLEPKNPASVSTAHLSTYQSLLRVPAFKFNWNKKEDGFQTIQIKKYDSLKG